MYSNVNKTNNGYQINDSLLPYTSTKRGSPKDEAAKPGQAVRTAVEATELEDAQQTKEAKEEQDALHQDVSGLCQHCIICQHEGGKDMLRIHS